jgi:hypothetical protein
MLRANVSLNPASVKPVAQRVGVASPISDDAPSILRSSLY